MNHRKPNRYCLIAKPSAITSIHEITKGNKLNESKMIFIDIPNEIEEEVVENKKKKKTTEEQSKTMLALIDTFIFNHSSKNGSVELVEYINEHLKPNRKIPNNYDFWIVYRSKNSYENTHFKFLEPIYGDTFSIVLWLKELAKVEYENREKDKFQAMTLMRESQAWNQVYNNMIESDVKEKRSLVDYYTSWVDTRGNISKMKNMNQKQALFQKIQELERRGTQNENEFWVPENYPLPVIMEAANRFPNNAGLWQSLRKKLCSYKELRGFLYCRYLYKKNELESDFENALKQEIISNYDKKRFQTLLTDKVSYYDALRHADYTIEELKEKNEWPINLDKFDGDVQRTVEHKLKKKQENDVVDVKYTETVFKVGEEYRSKSVYIEHEEELLYPEDLIPEYPEECEQTLKKMR